MKSPDLEGGASAFWQVCAEGRRRRALTHKLRGVRVPAGLPGHEGWGHEGGIEFGH